MKMQPRHVLLPVESVRLDVDNPRIRKWLEMYGESPTAEQIFLALGAGASEPLGPGGTSYRSLQESIRTNGGIIQPIVVNEDADGVMTAIDGNTRLAIYLEFNEQGVAGVWDQIPAIVYEELSSETIDAIRLQAHLVGPRAWDPYSKAKYLNHLHSREHMPFDRLVDFCGGQRRVVEHLIRAYQDMEKYYREILPDDSAFDSKRFSGFVELQKIGVKEAILASGHDLYDFSRWIHGRKIDALNEVRLLPRILVREECREVFLRSGAREAAKLLETPDASKALKTLSLSQVCRAVSARVREMTWKAMKEVQSDLGGEVAQAIFDAAQDLEDLKRDLLDEEKGV